MSGFDIYYGNGLKEGVDEAQAITDLANLLKIDEAAAGRIIGNRNRIIKSGLDKTQAQRYFELLHHIGLQVEIRDPMVEGEAWEETVIMKPLSSYEGDYEATAVMPAVGEQSADDTDRNDPPPPPESSTPDAEPAAGGEPRQFPVQFHGKGFEYFKIWIVNILLTILTLGIYSAWAKVRNKQYFYGNTDIDGSSFQYTARPLQILIGRLIAFAIFIVYAVITELFPPAGPILGLIFLLFLPWIVIRSLAFNARNSMYRNIRFRFSGGVGEAVMAYILWPLLSVFTLGLLLPMAWHRQIRFLVRNHSFGTTPFEFESGVKPFYKVFGLLILVIIAAIAIMGIATAIFASQPSTPVDSMRGLELFPILSFIMLVAYALMFAVIQAGLGNLRFNHSRLGEVSFSSALTIRGMAGLYIVNSLAIVISLGLLIPWAKVRTAAYRASCLTLTASSLDGFIAAEEQKISALGEQLGEVFDVDIVGGI